MSITLSHMIVPNPPPDEADTVSVSVDVEGYNSLYMDSTSIEEFLADDDEECRMREDLNFFLIQSGIHDDVTVSAMMDITDYVAQVACSPRIIYPPGCALVVYVKIEEAIGVSFNETNNFGFKPASKLVVNSLPRKIYEKLSSTGETCTICLEEFTNGGRLVTLPCGHEFDDECAVKWFETSHYCPLCRNMLPCEDQ